MLPCCVKREQARTAIEAAAPVFERRAIPPARPVMAG